MNARFARLRSVALVASGSVLVLLWLTPDGDGPRSLSWSDLDLWYRQVGPGVVVVAALRLSALAAALWLLVACVLQLLAALPVGQVVRPLADRVAPAALRGVAGASVCAGLLATSPVVGGASDAPGTATMRPMPDELPPTATSTTTTVVAPPSAQPAAPVAVPATEPDSYTVERSESFWTISADRMAEVLQRSPTEREVVGYWEEVIAANRDRLVDPGNADLLYAGQVLVLPPVR